MTRVVSLVECVCLCVCLCVLTFDIPAVFLSSKDQCGNLEQCHLEELRAKNKMKALILKISWSGRLRAQRSDRKTYDDTAFPQQ